MRGLGDWLGIDVDCAGEINKQCFDGRSIRHGLCESAMATVGNVMIGRLCVSQCHGLVDRFAE